MLRSEVRSYPLPYPAVFDAVCAVLEVEGPIASRDRDRGRVVHETRRRRITVFVGAAGTNRSELVVDVDGLMPRRRDLHWFVDALDEYLRYYFSPAT